MENLRDSQTQQETQNLNENPQQETEQRAPMETLLADWQQRNGLNEEPPEAEEEGDEEEEEDLSDLEVLKDPLPEKSELDKKFAAAFSEYAQELIPQKLQDNYILDVPGVATAYEAADVFLQGLMELSSNFETLKIKGYKYKLHLTAIEVKAIDLRNDKFEKENPDKEVPGNMVVGVAGTYHLLTGKNVTQLDRYNKHGTAMNPGIGGDGLTPIKVVVEDPYHDRQYEVHVFCHYQVHPLPRDKKRR